ncbi:MAG: response regulator transcription factor [Actinomycetota bacterium]
MTIQGKVKMVEDTDMAHRPVVLLVDDDPAMRDLLETIFHTHGGFRIGGVAQDGFEGAMMCADINPDVVVLDYFMPRWDGAKAAEFIRQHSPESKIIAFSAVLGEAPPWADEFLLKNDITHLLPLVEKMVGGWLAPA